MENLEERIKRVIEKRVNPKLAEHNGSCEFSEYNDGVVGIRMNGECSECMMAQITLDNIIKKELMDAFPGEVTDVVLDTRMGEDMLSMLKGILGRDINI